MDNDIKAVIESDIRPLIQKDGGDIEFVSLVDGVVSIKFSGACISCPYSFMTLKMGILDILSDKYSNIKDVVAV